MSLTSLTNAPVSPMSWVRRAIVVVDMVDSVRLINADESGVIARWRHLVSEVQSGVLAQHRGRLVKSLGDGLLLEFEDVTTAVAAALDVLRRVPPLNVGMAPAQWMQLRLGAHVADVAVDALDVYGAGVNLAARLASLADPGQCVVSAQLRDGVIPDLDAEIEDLGECFVKNLDEPVRAFRLLPVRAGVGDRREIDDSALQAAVAVLPLQSLDAAKDQGVLGDVLADEVTVSLAKPGLLRVISRLSTAAYKGRTATVGDLRQTLGAQYLLTGNYSLNDDVARVRVTLTDARTGDVLWADGFRMSMGEVLQGEEVAVQDIVRGITQAIRTVEVARATTLPMPNVESHALLTAAVVLMHRASQAEFERAHQMLQHLIERHARLPQPLVWLAKWHVLRVVQGWSAEPQRDGQMALDIARRAMDRAPDSSLARAMQGLVHAYLRHDFDSAGAAYRQALEINPNESMAQLLLGTMHAFLGEGAQAWPLARSAMALAPLDPLRDFYLSLSASAAISAGEYDEAIRLAKAALRLNRSHLSTHRALAIAQSLAGQLEDARATVTGLLGHEPGFTVSRFLQRYPGRDLAPAYAQRLADSLAQAGLPP